MPITDTDFLKKQFISGLHVVDAQKGYLSAPSFNLRINPLVLSAGARLIAQKFADEKIAAIHGIPHSGNYLAAAVSIAIGDSVRLHASRKDQAIPATWKEIYRREVRSFTASVGGVDVFSGINLSFVRKGDRVLLIDDVCARGDTGFSLIEGLLEKNVHVVGFAVLFDKVWQGGLARIESLGVKVFSCVRVKNIKKGDTVELL